MKGLDLAPNLLVILAIAVIALLAIVGLLLTQWGQGSEALELQSERSRACNILTTSRCTLGLDDIDVNIDVGIKGDRSDDNLMNLCADAGLNEENCAKSCGC